ncbi:MAG: DNA-binding response regulator [Caulobacteraceae bacterium]|nr:DNA-binding response regulator [Caulobacteraceae bacterium]
MYFPKLLVGDSDNRFGGMLADFLLSYGYEVTSAADGDRLDWLVSNERPDVCILEDKLLGEAGLSRLHRPNGFQRPAVIILSAAASEDDCIQALETGADDYLAKTCSPREVLARVRAIERGRRRHQPPARIAQYQFAGWTLSLAGSVLTCPNGELLFLSDGQFDLLKAFVENPGRLITRDELISLVKGENADTFDRSVDSQICRLRRSLDDAAGRQTLIRTVRAEGYMFSATVAAR